QTTVCGQQHRNTTGDCILTIPFHSVHIRLTSPDTDSPALSTCSNADIFRRMNTMLGNALDFTGVCTTPNSTKHKPDLTTVLSLFSCKMQGRKMHLLETLCIPLADKLKQLCRVSTLVPLSSACAALTPRMSRLPVLGMLNNPFSSILGKPPGYLPHESMNVTADFLEKFPGMARMVNRLDSSSFLDSRSSSPEDSETSGFSSGSDHLCDVLSNLRISPPLPYVKSNMQKDLLRLGPRLDPQDMSSPLTPPPSASPASSTISRRWRTGSPWPGSDMLDQSDDTFSIEREARLHRQAAAVNEATFTWSGQLPPRNNKDPIYSCKVFLGGVPWDITEAGLINTFSGYGPLTVEWPGKDGKHPRCPPKGNVAKGNCELVEKAVKIDFSQIISQAILSQHNDNFNKYVKIYIYIKVTYCSFNFTQERTGQEGRGLELLLTDSSVKCGKRYRDKLNI
uniref:RRM domain-containing protein n=1 Tax=Xiphophorus couchianus TaxID=32473 RepID=A0A3B5KZS3_9TELE